MKRNIFQRGVILFLVIPVLTTLLFSHKLLASDKNDIPPAFSHLPTFVLPAFSCTTADKVPHFVKMQISLAYKESRGIQRELFDNQKKIWLMIREMVKRKKIAEIETLEGTINLAEEIKRVINRMITSGKIREVYFTEMVMN